MHMSRFGALVVQAENGRRFLEVAWASKGGCAGQGPTDGGLRRSGIWRWLTS